MKLKRFFFFAVVGAMAILLTACGAAPASNWPGLATDGTHVYLSSNQYVYDVLVKDGSEVTTVAPDSPTPVPARFPLKADGAKSFYAAPALTTDGQVLIGNAATGDHTFFSYDPTTTNIKWSIPATNSPWMAGALVFKDTIYAPGGDGVLYAYSLAGEKRWVAELSQHSLWSTPVSDGKLVFEGTLDHQIFALDMASGKQTWKTDVETSVMASPVMAGDTLVVGTLGGKLFGLDAATGAKKWTATLEGGIWGSPVYDGSNVYIGTVLNKTGKFYAVNASNGQTAWSRDDDGSITAAALVAGDQIIYVTELGKVQALDKTGTPKWQQLTENAHYYTPPVLAGDMVLVAPMNATFQLAAYDLTGAQKWTFTAK